MPLPRPYIRHSDAVVHPYHALTSSQVSEPVSKLLQTSRWALCNQSARHFGPNDWAVKPRHLWMKQSPDFPA